MSIIEYNKTLDHVLSNFKAINDSMILFAGNDYVSVRDTISNGRVVGVAVIPDLNLPFTCLINNISDFASIYRSISGKLTFNNDSVVIDNGATAIKYQYGIFPTDENDVRKLWINKDNLPKFDDSTLIYAANVSAKDFKMIESANQYLRYSNFFYAISKEDGSFNGRDIKDGQTIKTTNTFTHRVDCTVNRLEDDVIFKSTDFCFLSGDYTLEIHKFKLNPRSDDVYYICEASTILADGTHVKYLITFLEEWNAIQLGKV